MHVHLYLQNQVATEDYYTVRSLEGFDERKVVGGGSYGAVYEVMMNGTPCIAKVVHDILVGQGGHVPVGSDEVKDIREKFHVECSLLSKLKHPNIVQFLGVYREKGEILLVMEFMPMDLSKCLDTCMKQKYIIPLPKAVHPPGCDQWAASPSFLSSTHHPS